MSGKDHHMPKSQQTLLAIITFVFLLEIILTAFFISFSAPIFKGLTIIHGILIVVFLTRQIKRKGFDILIELFLVCEHPYYLGWFLIKVFCVKYDVNLLRRTM